MLKPSQFSSSIPWFFFFFKWSNLQVSSYGLIVNSILAYTFNVVTMHISAACTLASCFILAQHSVPYNKVGLGFIQLWPTHFLSKVNCTCTPCYSVFNLLNLNPFDSNVFLWCSSLSFTCFFILLIGTTSANSINCRTSSWISAITLLVNKANNWGST